MKAKLGATATALAVTLGLAACGSPTSGARGNDGGGAADTLDDVYAELEGLKGDERRQRLEELAAEEDQQITWYTTTPLGDSKPMVERFREEYGLDVEIYRASSSDLLKRVLQESEADQAASDVVTNNGEEMEILADEGVLVPLETPLRDDIVEEARYDAWLGIYLNVPSVAWNTDALGDGEQPTSWEQVLSEYRGDLAMEAKAWDWFATLVQEHFMAEKGMTEDEAIELFREAARGATPVDGNTTIAELLAAGEHDVVAATYKNHVEELANEGAPVAWEKPVEPIVVTTNGTGIHRDTEAPATALLFLEYTLTDGQEVLVDAYRTPANTEYGGLPEDYDTIIADPPEMIEQREKWEKLYEEVIRESGSDIVEQG